MADNSPSPRVQPEDEYYYCNHTEVTGYNYFISYLPIP